MPTSYQHRLQTKNVIHNDGGGNADSYSSDSSSYDQEEEGEARPDLNGEESSTISEGSSYFTNELSQSEGSNKQR